jgi:hypothetical protein
MAEASRLPHILAGVGPAKPDSYQVLFSKTWRRLNGSSPVIRGNDKPNWGGGGH